MALVYDGTANSLRDRVTDLEGEVFGPNGSAYRLHQKLTGVENIDAATVLSPGGGTARTLAEWMGDVVNVKAFGAKGDDRDDTQAFIDAATKAGRGGTVIVPWTDGRYRVTAQIPFTCNYVGVSRRGNDYITANATAGSVIYADGDFHTLGNGSSSVVSAGIEGLIFKGTSTAHAHVHLTGGARLITVRGCGFYGKRNAVFLDGLAFVVKILENMLNEQAGDGVLLDYAAAPQNDITIADNWIRRSAGNGVYAAGAAGVTLLAIERNSITDGEYATGAVVVRQASGVTVMDNDIEGWGKQADNSYIANSRGLDLSAQALRVGGNVLYGSAVPFKILATAGFEVLTNRILKDTSPAAEALTVDATSSNGIIHPQRTDFTTAATVSASAENVTNMAGGALACNRARTYSGALTTGALLTANGGILLPATKTLRYTRASVASAGTITEMPDANYILVTGTTDISFIVGKPAGTVVVFEFESSLTVRDSPPAAGNLRLTADLVAVAGSTLTLMARGDSASWVETARSVN